MTAVRISMAQSSAAAKILGGMPFVRGLSWIALAAAALAALWISNALLTSGMAGDFRLQASRKALEYAEIVGREAGRAAALSRMAASDPGLNALAEGGEFDRAAESLGRLAERTGARSVHLIDDSGAALASGGESAGGARIAGADIRAALESGAAIAIKTPPGERAMAFVNRLGDAEDSPPLFLAAVFEAGFPRASPWDSSEIVAVTRADGTIIASSLPSWVGASLPRTISELESGGVFGKPYARMLRLIHRSPDLYFYGAGYVLETAPAGSGGLSVSYFASFSPARQTVNAILALEAAGFAALLALLLHLRAGRLQRKAAALGREAGELRTLAARLGEEASKRGKFRENLRTAEDTLDQRSRLSALGEMSASVSHELNQPLGAMKTYLASAKMLLERGRPVEAMAAFGRMDALIERMGAITGQLRAYARHNKARHEPMDLRDAVIHSTAMMAPKMDEAGIALERKLPETPVIVSGDMLRLEQVIINLVRNALDATRGQKSPRLSIALTALDGTAWLSVEDNGTGIEDFEALFEPFHTTKDSEENVGLGLAISSGIVKGLGGTLTARNLESGGAGFDLRLPLVRELGNHAENAHEQ